MSVRQNGVVIAGGGEAKLTGFVAPFAGSTAPSGWLVCDGSAVSRTDYADLFAVIGTTYGVGDGGTTFNLPDISDCFVQGGTPGITHTAGLPNITGLFYGQNAALTGGSGAFFTGNNPYGSTVSVGSANNQISFDASRSSSIYGNSTTVQPKSVEMLYCIKY